MNPTIKNRRVEEVFAVVSADYPDLFLPETPKPLKIDIHKELYAVYGGRLSRRKISDFMRVWAALPSYVRARDTSPVRYGLNGEIYPNDLFKAAP